MTDDVTIRHQKPSDLPALRLLIEQAWNDDELAGRSRRDIDRWLERLPDDPDSTLVAHAGDEAAGFLSKTWSAIIVAPAWRRRGIGRALIAAALAEHPGLEMSVPHHSQTAEPFLRAVGFRFDHRLWQMRLDQDTNPSPLNIPKGFVLRTFDDSIFDRYFQLVNQAFADHPTPIEVSEARMRAVHDRPDFDPSLLAVIAKADDPANLVAFTFLRTPVVENGVLSSSIGMVGVDRPYRRLGLGRQLLRWGIHRLRDAGCEEITLEVVETNERALPLYEREGFKPVQAWPYWKPAGN